MIFELNMIPLFVAVPLGGAFLISLIGKRIKVLPDIVGILSTAAMLGLSILAVGATKTSSLVYSVGAWKPPVGIAMVLDGLSSFMLVTISVVAFLVAIYSINYMERFTSKWKFYTLFLLMIAGMNGVVISGDMFNLFVFLEIAAVASYALVAFGTERQELEAAFKYAIMGTLGSAFILLGIVFLYSYTSTLNMADMALTISQKGVANVIPMVSVLFLMGFGLKAALVPFHAWLPDAHPSAPAPISAMLSGVLIKSLGVYAICRIFYNVLGASSGILNILMFLGALSMVIGGVLAIGQWDFKRLLAYSSISQIGYVMLGIGLGTPLGIVAGLFHLFNHSIFKSLLFLNSGAVEYSTGTRDLRKMGGLGSRMPITATTGFLGSMSIAGIPPFNGFWSKLFIIVAAVQAGRPGYALCAVLVSILTLAMYVKVLRYAFLGDLKDRWGRIKEVPLFMKISMVVLGLICVVGGVLFLPGIKEVFLDPAGEVLTQGVNYAEIIFERIR